MALDAKGALHIICHTFVRRLGSKGEMTGTRTLLVLLDWEKAFDRILHDKFMEALRRVNVPDEMVNAIHALYKEPTFFAQLDGQTSNTMQQSTGIRQGCPLPLIFS